MMSTFLIKPATSQSSSYSIVLTRLGGPRSGPNPHLKFVDVPGIEPGHKKITVPKNGNEEEILRGTGIREFLLFT